MGPLLGVALGGALLKGSMDAFDSLEQATKRLQIGFDAIHQPEALDQLTGWASDFADQTGILQADVEDFSGKLLNMGSGFFKQAGPAGLKLLEDMTTALEGMSAESGKSAQMLMRSLGPAILNTPDKAIPLLVKFGALTDEQAAKVKALTDAGDKQAASQLIINDLTTKYGDAAARAATPSAKFRESLNKIETTIGQGLEPVFKDLNAVLQPIIHLFADLPGPIQSATVGVGLAAVAFKLFGGSLGGSLKSLGRLIGILPKLAVETEAVAAAEGEAAAAGTAATAGSAGFAGGLGKLGIAAVIAAGAIYDVQGAIKIYNAIQDTAHANAQARTQDMDRWANDAVNEIILTGQLSRGHAAYIRGLIKEGDTQGSVAALQERLDIQVQQGRITWDQYQTTIKRTGLQLHVTKDQMAGVQLQGKALEENTNRLITLTLGAERSFDKYRASVKRLGQSLANLPKNVNTDYTLTYHYLTVGAPPPGTPGGMHAPQIAAATGFHGMVDRPVTFLAGERGPERVDIGPAGSSGSASGGVTKLSIDLHPDRRRFVEAFDYEMRFGGPG